MVQHMQYFHDDIEIIICIKSRNDIPEMTLNFKRSVTSEMNDRSVSQLAAMTRYRFPEATKGTPK